MQTNDVRVQLRPHRNPTDDRLHRNTGNENESDTPIGAASAAKLPQHDELCDAHGQQDESQQAISKFDDPMDSHFGSVYQGIFGAFGPRRAPESRRRQTHEPAGSDDPNLCDEVQPRHDDNGSGCYRGRQGSHGNPYGVE